MLTILNQLYAIMDKGPLRALSLFLALLLAGCVFWQPDAFAAKTSTLEIWHGLLIMWAVCSGIIHGIGFRPIKLKWRTCFAPLPAMMILITGIIYFIG